MQIMENKKKLILILSLFFIIGSSAFGFAAKVPAPDKGGIKQKQ